jgi:hypothetical protein
MDVTVGPDGGTISAERRVCDGSDGIRLAIGYDGQLARHEAYTAVLYDLGYPYIIIDGTCRYWLNSWGGGQVRRMAHTSHRHDRHG